MFPSALVVIIVISVLVALVVIIFLGLWLSFYLGYSPIELWDSLSTYVHPGIACLASQACDWLGTFWASLSGLQSSVTLVRLNVIGHFL